MRATLKKKDDFARVFRFGRTIKEEGIVFRYVLNKTPHTRLAFVVSKAVAPRATLRNKIKRRLRAAAQESNYILKSSVDGVFIANKNIQMLKPTTIKEKVRVIFQKITQKQQ